MRDKMRQNIRAKISAFVVILAVVGGACADRHLGPDALASVSLDTVYYPSVVLGDSMRDTFGVALPLRGHALNSDGNPLQNIIVKYRGLDSGIFVDSLTGYVVGDTLYGTPFRVLVDANGLQTPPMQLFVVPTPDTLIPIHAYDSLSYSLSDSTVNYSSVLSAGVMHHISTDSLTGVQAYFTSFAIVYPTDTVIAQLVNNSGQRTRAFTTDATGTATVRVYVRPGKLANPTDSVVILASSKYKGVPLIGSPVRLVLKLKPPF